jgi:hypothetical protein
MVASRDLSGAVGPREMRTREHRGARDIVLGILVEVTIAVQGERDG